MQLCAWCNHYKSKRFVIVFVACAPGKQQIWPGCEQSAGIRWMWTEWITKLFLCIHLSTYISASTKHSPLQLREHKLIYHPILTCISNFHRLTRGRMYFSSIPKAIATHKHTWTHKIAGIDMEHQKVQILSPTHLICSRNRKMLFCFSCHSKHSFLICRERFCLEICLSFWKDICKQVRNLSIPMLSRENKKTNYFPNRQQMRHMFCI